MRIILPKNSRVTVATPHATFAPVQSQTSADILSWFLFVRDAYEALPVEA